MARSGYRNENFVLIVAYWIARAFGLDLTWTAYLFHVVFLGFLVFVASTFGIQGTY